MRDPRQQLQTTYEGLTIHIQPHMDDFCDLMSTFVLPGTDIQHVRLRLNRFLSAMAWKDNRAFITRGDIAGGARPQDSDKPRFNYGEKRRLPYGIISRFDFEHLVVPSNDRQRLALALFRDGLDSDNAFYKFLSYYKIVNILHSRPDDQMEWMNANIPSLRFDAAERAKQLAQSNGDLGKYLYVQGRTAIAHAFASPIRDPDLPADRMEIREDCRLIKGLAALLIERELGIPSLPKIWHDHLYELAGFKELFGEGLTGRLARGEPVGTGEFSVPKLTLRLKDHLPYRCLERVEFQAVSCESGTLVLATNPETEPMLITIILNFPAETLNFDLTAFAFNQKHWRFRTELAESYYQFLWDYYGNGCLEIYDSLNGDRLSHKLGFIPMNIDFRRLQLDLELQKSILTSKMPGAPGSHPGVGR